MRKLKLQMQVTVNGFVAGPNDELDWMTWDMDEKLLSFIIQLIDTSDTILMGRKMTPGFVKYWEEVLTRPNSAEYEMAKKMVDTPKIVFSKTVSTIEGRNVRVENASLADALKKLKEQDGKDMIVYGGAGFVSSLMADQLIDELNLF